MIEEKIKIEEHVNVLQVFSSAIDKYWSLVKPMLIEAIEYDGDAIDIDDLKDNLKNNKFKLFVMFGSDDEEEHKLFGVCVVRITALPNFRQCEVPFLKGEKRELWQDKLVDTIEDFAKKNNCKKMAILARPGWRSFAKTKSLEVKRYLYTKEIK
jgi:hypothetical protein